MITACKSRWFDSLFAVYNKNLIKRRFHTVETLELSAIENRFPGCPLLFYANHSSWWDGLLAFEISRKTRLDSYVMMDEKQLKKLFLFRKLGAFSVGKKNRRDALESINYAAALLSRDSRRALWIFPQGRIAPNDVRPLRFYNGLSKIIEKIRTVQVVPVAFRYEFLGEWKPSVFIKFGEIKSYNSIDWFDAKKNTQLLADNLTVNLNRLNERIRSENFDGFEKLI